MLRVLVAVLVVLGLVAAYYVGLIFYVDQSIRRTSALAPTAAEILRPSAQAGASNYLVVVSDGDSDGARTETILLAHVAADETSSALISFPRTALVDAPACRGANGNQLEPRSAALVDVFQLGGPNCLVRTIQGITGVRINHYVRIDLSGFASVVDAVGGVPVCLRAPLSDPQLGLTVPAGKSTLTGARAVDYLRAVSGGGQTDLGRTSRQLGLLSATFQKALAGSTLLNPLALTDLLTATADALTLDDDTSLGELKTLVDAVGDPEDTSLALLVAPVANPEYTPVGSADVYAVLDPQAGRELFDAVIDDGPLPTPPPPEPTGAEAVTAVPEEC